MPAMRPQLLLLGLLGSRFVATSGEDSLALEEILERQNAELRTRISALELEELHDISGVDELLTVASTPAAARDRRLSASAALVGTQERRLLTSDDAATCLDTMWLLVAGALVMFMQSGFAFLEAGSVQKKNSGIVLLKNVIDVSVGTIMWWLLGYGFAYGKPDNFGMAADDNKFVGVHGFAGSGYVSLDSSGSIDGTFHTKDWFFQWAFCATSATIVSGGVAERIKMPAYVIYSTFMSVVIYPFIVFWTWSGSGFLTVDWGYSDFAGSGIVHLTGGVGALVGALCLGPRKGRWENPNDFAPGNMGLVVLGTLILWFGWYGFNCGSTLTFSDKATAISAASVAMNTTCSAAAGGSIVFLMRLYSADSATLKQYDLGGMCNGILAGLVAVCAAVGDIESGMAMLIGTFGGIAYEVTHIVVLKLRIDDPLDAFAVHGAGGLVGCLVRPLLSSSGVNGTQMQGMAFGALIIILWSGGLSLLIFGALRLAGLLRASDEEELIGGDSHLAHTPMKDSVQTIQIVPNGSSKP
eukprot:TRINITY_DN165_c1_g1_i2.p1 TRINITY_DN165_c1_g1~~TRINITY_DN165_c1_g1_i2.p1  ORF type:complete len:526 (-),score=92.01 TRINITY_DN165_c1_g1_i2:218-1795(-)